MDKEIVIYGVLAIGIGIAAYFLLHAVSDTVTGAAGAVNSVADEAASLPGKLISGVTDAESSAISSISSAISGGLSSLESAVGLGGGN